METVSEEKKIIMPSGEKRTVGGIIWFRGIWFHFPPEQRNRDCILDFAIKKLGVKGLAQKRRKTWIEMADCLAKYTDEDIEEIVSDKYKDLYKNTNRFQKYNRKDVNHE